jgi:ribosomal protein L17
VAQTLAEKVKAFLDEMAVDVVEERVVEYVIREVNNGRKLADVLNDPYVKNRFSEDKVAHVVENPEIAAAIEEQIATAFRKREFGFSDTSA